MTWFRRSDYVLQQINSLWPNDALWWYWTASALVHVIACCLMASSHYLKVYWFIISYMQWQSPNGNFTRNNFNNVVHGMRNIISQHLWFGDSIQWSRLIPSWPNDAAWRHESESTLTRAMACWLMAPTDYQNQRWLLFHEWSLLSFVWEQFHSEWPNCSIIDWYF